MKDESMLNLLNILPENEAEYLYNKDEDRAFIQQSEAEANRHMDMYVAQNGNLTAIGYLDNNLVWFSVTRINDLFFTRRVFDCMKVGSFYRRATFDKALSTASVTARDLEFMCHIGIQHMERDHPTFSGCLVSQSEQEDGNALTGIDFAKIIAVLPMRLSSAIPQIGSEDDIITELEKDYATLESLYSSDSDPYEPSKNMTALTICNKWRSVECLKMSGRAAIRTLYHDICYHRYASL